MNHYCLRLHNEHRRLNSHVRKQLQMLCGRTFSHCALLQRVSSRLLTFFRTVRAKEKNEKKIEAAVGEGLCHSSNEMTPFSHCK